MGHIYLKVSGNSKKDHTFHFSFSNFSISDTASKHNVEKQNTANYTLIINADN